MFFTVPASFFLKKIPLHRHAARLFPRGGREQILFCVKFTLTPVMAVENVIPADIFIGRAAYEKQPQWKESHA
jgi:hypothetical protein